MIAFIDLVKDRFGVEATCRVLNAMDSGFITARGYRAAKTRPPSARRFSDELLGTKIARLHKANYGVYGVRKMHRAMPRNGWVLGRDQTGRIMRDLGLRGVKRSTKVFTTHADPAGVRPTDLVERRFLADGPRRLLGRGHHLHPMLTSLSSRVDELIGHLVSPLDSCALATSGLSSVLSIKHPTRLNLIHPLEALGQGLGVWLATSCTDRNQTDY